MSTPLPLGLAPYISPLTLITAPTGIDWSTIGEATADPTPPQNLSEIWSMCARATARTDGYLSQTLRATVDVELLHGPDYRVTAGPASGGSYPTPYWGASAPQNARLIMSRWPVLQVTSVKTCPNGVWPRTWTAIPDGYAEPEVPPIGLLNTISPGGSAEGGQAVLVGGGYVNWSLGRNGWAIEVTYINGYPHCSLTEDADAGVSSLPVDDCTGWGITNYYGTVTGATGVVQDGGQQEAVHVSSTSVSSGAGNLVLSQPTAYAHDAGTVVTTMPASVQQACIYFAAAEALTRGATSTTIHAVGGAAQGSDKAAEDLIAEGELLLHAFRRTVLRRVVVSCGKHTTRRQAHATARAKGSHTVRKAAHTATRQSTTNKARKATSAANAHRQARAMSKTRPKATKASKAPKKTTKRKLSAAQLKARNTAHRKASKRARATARAHAQAKLRADAKARASGRAAAKTRRSHVKSERFYCQVSTRTAAKVTKPTSASQAYNRHLAASASARAVAAAKAQARARAPKGMKSAKAAR